MLPTEGTTCLGLEYFCFEGDAFWSLADEKLIALASQELVKLGFVHASDIEDGTVVRMPKAYPIYDLNYSDSLNAVKQFLNSLKNFQTVGRNGLHKYNNMDHSMLTAIEAVEHILGRPKKDLWKVNAEKEYHKKVAENTIERMFARIDKLGFSLSIGIVSGLFIFILTLLSILRDGEAASTWFRF